MTKSQKSDLRYVCEGLISGMNNPAVLLDDPLVTYRDHYKNMIDDIEIYLKQFNISFKIKRSYQHNPNYKQYKITFSISDVQKLLLFLKLSD